MSHKIKEHMLVWHSMSRHKNITLHLHESVAQIIPVGNSCDKQGPGSAGVSNIELAHVSKNSNVRGIARKGVQI